MIDWTKMQTQEAREAAELADEQARALREAVAMLDAAGDAITGAVPLAERLSWGTKAAAARAHLAGTATAGQTAMLSAEAAITGHTVTALAERIGSRAAAYAQASARISGLRQVTAAAIDAASDPEGVNAALAALRAALADTGPE